MNQVVVQVCFLVSGVLTGCAAMPASQVATYYEQPAQTHQYVYIDNGPVNNMTSQPNWHNIKRSMQPRHSYTPVVVRTNNTRKVRVYNYRPRVIRGVVRRRR